MKQEIIIIYKKDRQMSYSEWELTSPQQAIGSKILVCATYTPQ